ncbi:MAG: hypothetical protein CMH31_02320 [Micavibrio sp.]|nr:hypothetical protein [Micavibrio sp.]
MEYHGKLWIVNEHKGYKLVSYTNKCAPINPAYKTAQQTKSGCNITMHKKQCSIAIIMTKYHSE